MRCPCECNEGGFCGGCGHVGCGGRQPRGFRLNENGDMETVPECAVGSCKQPVFGRRRPDNIYCPPHRVEWGEPLPCAVCGVEGHAGNMHNRKLRRYRYWEDK